MKKTKSYKDFPSKGKSTVKNQLILINSSRNFKDYLSSLKNRHFGKYNKIPNYIITNEGGIHKLLQDDEYSGFFKNENINKIDWFNLSKNPNAIDLLNKNIDKINWHCLSENINGHIILKNYIDKIYWFEFLKNPNAIDLILQNKNKIDLLFANQRIKIKQKKLNSIENLKKKRTLLPAE